MEDLCGKKFGQLTALRYIGKDTGGCARWECSCDCGALTTVRANNLKSGAVRSCGCLVKTTLRANRYKHGGSNTKLYNVWRSMRNRCKNPNVPEYHAYGGRGIYVCDEWEDFSVFKEWAIEHGYNEGLTIDRIDVDGPYTPSNCRWLPRDENIRLMATGRHTKTRGLYHAIDPNGNEYVFDNMTVFAREHNMSRWCLGEVARGNKESYNGWRVYCA